jgi:hypothetical protein
MAASLILCGCMPALVRGNNQKIPVEHERLYLAPLVNQCALSTLPGWPSNSAYQQILLQRLSDLEETMAIELRRCAKFGLYEVVDEPHQASVLCTLLLSEAIFLPDTLKIAGSFAISILSSNQRIIFPLQTTGILQSTNPPATAFNRLGLLIIDACRQFPVAELIGHFYTQPKNEFQLP